MNVAKKKAREIWNTDNAPAGDVLTILSFCASTWEPEARLIGNIRAIDIAKACEEAIAAIKFKESH